MYTLESHRKKITIRFQCTRLEGKYLEVCAKKAGRKLTAYMHDLALKDYPGLPKTLAPEVREAVGQLMQVAALLHPFSRKRLDGEEFNALERVEVKQIIRELEVLTQKIKNLIP
jgi:hypothetical protein